MKKIKQSETIIIKRSKLNFAPYNPKKHAEKDIKKQLGNFKNIGFLGGVVWNELTGNIVSGHKRVMAMDIYYKYPEIDYELKVEKVSLTEKQEKEQNIYMDAKGTNTTQDYILLADLLPDIDIAAAGLEMRDLEMITIVAPNIELGTNSKIKEDFKEASKELKDNKEAIKKIKNDIKQGLANAVGANYVTLSFENYENKTMFMEAIGYAPDNLYINGEGFFDKINNNK